MTDRIEEIRERLEGYLAGGGLFNPELANHDAVRDLIIDCRDLIDAKDAEIERLREALKFIRDRHIPDQPSALDIDRDAYVERQYQELRREARLTLLGAAS